MVGAHGRGGLFISWLPGLRGRVGVQYLQLTSVLASSHKAPSLKGPTPSPSVPQAGDQAVNLWAFGEHLRSKPWHLLFLKDETNVRGFREGSHIPVSMTVSTWIHMF